MVAAGNVKWQATARVDWWTVHHCVGTFWALGQEELDGLDSIIVGSHMNGKTTHLVDIIDSFLVGTVNDFKCRQVVMSRSMVNGKSTHVVTVDQCLGEQDQDHINQQSPCSTVSGNLVQSQFSSLHISLLGKFWVLVENAFHHGPVLLLNLIKEFQKFSTDNSCGHIAWLHGCNLTLTNNVLGRFNVSWCGHWRRCTEPLHQICTRLGTTVHGLNSNHGSQNIIFSWSFRFRDSILVRSPSSLNDRCGSATSKLNFKDKHSGRPLAPCALDLAGGTEFDKQHGIVVAT
mmetsp:Transcript_10555/g.25486  ORF Transcript_10555/g.25486 Transcript_10555/m.25486 type:complete len:288 (+) Transcript_10555:2181-3044(+)